MPTTTKNLRNGETLIVVENTNLEAAHAELALAIEALDPSVTTRAFSHAVQSTLSRHVLTAFVR